MLINSILSKKPNTALREGMIVVKVCNDNIIIAQVLVTGFLTIEVMYAEYGEIVSDLWWTDEIRCADSAEKRKFRKQLKQPFYANITE